MKLNQIEVEKLTDYLNAIIILAEADNTSTGASIKRIALDACISLDKIVTEAEK